MKSQQILYRQFVCIIPIYAQFFMIGITRGWIAPILNEADHPDSELPLTSDQSSWMASLGFITRGLSPIFLWLLLDRMSRNSILVFNAFINFGSWLVIYWSRDIIVHYILRLVSGLSDGFQETLSSIYVCENCSPRYRGTFYTIAILFRFAGHFIAFVEATFFQYSGVAIINIALGFVALLSALFLVEPAQYLLMKGNLEKAKKNFGHLRDMNDPATVQEFEAIIKNIEEEKSKTINFQLYRSTEVLKSMRLVLIILSLCTGCGWSTVVAFATKLFSNSKSLSANQFSMLYGMFQFVCVGASSTIMDKFNRRTLLLVSGIIIFTIHAGIVALYNIQYSYDIPRFKVILFILLTIFSCLCAMFIFPLIGLLKGELFPQSVKIMGGGLSTFMVALVSFVNARTFLPIAETFGMEFNFAIYGGSALLLVVYSYFDLPETRGKTLVEIQNELKGIGERKS